MKNKSNEVWYDILWPRHCVRHATQTKHSSVIVRTRNVIGPPYLIPGMSIRSIIGPIVRMHTVRNLSLGRGRTASYKEIRHSSLHVACCTRGLPPPFLWLAMSQDTASTKKLVISAKNIRKAKNKTARPSSARIRMLALTQISGVLRAGRCRRALPSFESISSAAI